MPAITENAGPAARTIQRLRGDLLKKPPGILVSLPSSSGIMPLMRTKPPRG